MHWLGEKYKVTSHLQINFNVDGGRWKVEGGRWNATRKKHEATR